MAASRGTGGHHFSKFFIISITFETFCWFVITIKLNKNNCNKFFCVCRIAILWALSQVNTFVVFGVPYGSVSALTGRLLEECHTFHLMQIIALEGTDRCVFV